MDKKEALKNYLYLHNQVKAYELEHPDEFYRLKEVFEAIDELNKHYTPEEIDSFIINS